jgi:nitroreductase
MSWLMGCAVTRGADIALLALAQPIGSAHRSIDRAQRAQQWKQAVEVLWLIAENLAIAAAGQGLRGGFD